MSEKKLERLSDSAVLEELGRRFEMHRRNLRIPDQELFDRGGVKKDTLAKFKKGKNISLVNWIKILRGAQLLSRLDLLFEDVPSFSPIAMMNQKHIALPKRIRQKSQTPKSVHWGDE